MWDLSVKTQSRTHVTQETLPGTALSAAVAVCEHVPGEVRWLQTRRRREEKSWGTWMMTWEKSQKMKKKKETERVWDRKWDRVKETERESKRERDRDRGREVCVELFLENMTNSTGNVTGLMASCQTDILTDIRLHYTLCVCVCVCCACIAQWGVTRLSDFWGGPVSLLSLGLVLLGQLPPWDNTHALIHTPSHACTKWTTTLCVCVCLLLKANQFCQAN